MSSPEQQPNDAPGNNDDHGIMSSELEASILVAYRSIGLGTFGAAMRYAGMPLEKVALFMNSSQVSGSNQFRQSMALTFREGPLAPYRVVGPASLVAWFMAYSVMGMSFQFFDRALSGVLGVAPVWYGKEVMDPPPPSAGDVGGDDVVRGGGDVWRASGWAAPVKKARYRDIIAIRTRKRTASSSLPRRGCTARRRRSTG